MVQAIKRGIEACTDAGKRADHFSIHLGQRLGGEVALGDSRLIGHDNHFEPHPVQPPDRRPGARAEMELVHGKRRVHQSDLRVVHDVVNHAVAIKEDCSHIAA